MKKLTDERIEEIFQSVANDDPEVHIRFARAIEDEFRVIDQAAFITDAFLVDSIARMRSQTAWLRNGTLEQPCRAMAVSHMEAVLEHVDALRTYRAMAGQVREHWQERAKKAEPDAEQYRWLRSQHWNDGTLAVIRSADLPLGLQTFSGRLLDDAIAVRRMASIRQGPGQPDDGIPA